MKRIWILLMSFLVCVVFGRENDYFLIKSDGFWTGGSKIDVFCKGIKNVENITLKIGDNVLDYVEKDGEDKYIFEINSNLNISNLTTKLVVNGNQYFGPQWPYFVGLDLTNLTGGSNVKILGSFTGSCVLHLSNGLSLSLSNKDGQRYVRIPEDIKGFINGGYVECDGLFSNYVNFKIYPSPEILYIIGKDNKLEVGGKIIIKGKYLKVFPNDNVKVILGSDEITENCDFENKEIICQLPKKNFLNTPVKVIRNGFKSNEVKINVYTTPIIKSINFEYWDGKSTMKIYGDFPYYLGKLVVNFEGHNLEIVETGKNFVRVLMPVAKKAEDGSFSCPHVFKPGFLNVKVGNVYSNSYFVYSKDFPKISYVEMPYCNTEGCFIKFYTNEQRKIKVYLNGSKKTIYGQLLNLVRIKTNGLVKKGILYIVNDNCLRSYDYVFDFSDYWTPKIYYIKSNHNFKPSDEIKIIGDKIGRDGGTGDMKVKLTINPKNAILKDSIKIGYNDIKGEISYNVSEGQKVSLKIQNRNGVSNEGVFIVGGKSKYIASPVIYNVKYEDGGGGGKQVKIIGVGFSDICSNNQIIFGGKVVYPDECSYTQLKFILPKDTVGDSIQVKTILDNSNWLISNVFKFDGKLGGFVPDEGNFRILNSENSYITLNLGKDHLDQEIKFKILNHKKSYFINKLKVYLETNYDFSPFESIMLSVNGNDNSYFYNKFQKKVYKTSQKNYGFIHKTKDRYEITFHNIYIPYSLEPIELSIKFKLYKFVKKSGKIILEIPSQNLYLYNIFSDNEKLENIKIAPVQLATINLFKTNLICFDSDKDYSNCSYVLKGKNSLKLTESKDEKAIKVDNDNKSGKTEVSSNKSVNKKISIYEKIAKKLNKDLVKKLNKVLYNRVENKKKKYPLNVYLKKMKAYVVLMRKVNIDSYEDKFKYARYLIGFVKYYKLFKNSISK